MLAHLGLKNEARPDLGDEGAVGAEDVRTAVEIVDAALEAHGGDAAGRQG